jgi:hypothetical protein
MQPTATERARVLRLGRTDPQAKHVLARMPEDPPSARGRPLQSWAPRDLVCL